MTDPMDTLKGLQIALDRKLIKLSKCALHSDLQVMLDRPNGEPRFTYARMTGRKVQAITVIVMSDPVNGVPCFQIGYAVSQPMRGKGEGTKILQQSLEEFKNGFIGKMSECYMEAIVGVDNHHSNSIAKKLISENAVSIIDEDDGEPAYQYLAKISLAPVLKRAYGVKH